MIVLFLQQLSSHAIYIYIYTHISKDLMWESMRFYHVVHSMKRIEILLSHIGDKNKFKNRDFLFSLVQCFKTTFCYFFFFTQCFKTTICFIWLNVSRLFLPYTQKSLCIYIHPFHFYSFIYTCLKPFMPSHLKYT